MAFDPTVDPLSQDLELVKADSDEYLVTVTEPNPASPDDPTTRLDVDLSEAVDGTADRYAIVRFAAKRKGRDLENTEALLFKDSQAGASEVTILDQALNPGECEILIDVADTIDSDEPLLERDDTESAHDWDLEVNRQDVERSGASQVGTVTFVNGSTTVSGTATAFTNAKVGDILQSLDAGNPDPAIITAIVSDTELTVGRSIWTTSGAGESFEIRRNRKRTAAAGDFFFRRGRVKG